MKHNYDYYRAWHPYALEKEEQRFLFTEEDLLKICECIDLKKEKQTGVTGCVPIHYNRNEEKLYVLSGDAHTAVSGETGSKKSRTICRGSVISSILCGNSVICVDPKGEISSDKKIQQLLKDKKYRTYVLDFRSFDKDGINLFSNIIRHAKKGDETKAMDEINRFVGVINDEKPTNDHFWNDTAGMMITYAMQFLLMTLSQQEELLDTAYHLISLKQFLGKNKRELIAFCEDIMPWVEEGTAYDAILNYSGILGNPQKTYACISSSVDALLKPFGICNDVLRMLSVSTFDPQTFYEEPSILFIVKPDEVKAYDQVVGYVVDMLYQILVSAYTEKYQGKREAPCRVNMICDEFASIRINDMRSKISASRSRQINWVLIYQSERQLEKAYPCDYGTIQGNCRHQIFLGACDYQSLKAVSERTGITYISQRETVAPMVSVEDLRRMRKEREYKEALVMSGNYLYCAKLPDYDYYDFLEEGEEPIWENHVAEEELLIYSPERLLEAFKNGEIHFFSKKVQSEEENHNEIEELSDDQLQLIKEQADKIRSFHNLFGHLDVDDWDDDW